MILLSKKNLNSQNEQSATGTNITIDNPLNNLKFKSLQLEGQTEQTTYTGKNLYHAGTDTKTQNNITTNYNNSECILNGTTQNGAAIMGHGQSTGSSSRTVGTFPAGTYKFTFNHVAGTLTYSSGASAFYIRKPDNTEIFSYQVSSTTETFTRDFTLTEETILYVEWYVNSANWIFDNYKVQFQIETGSTSTSYEPYVGGTASPNSDYPQDVHVVTGECGITVSNSDNINSETYPLSLGDIELCKIGDYQDYIYKDGDDWYVYKIIGKVILDGTNNYFYSSYSTNTANTNRFRTNSIGVKKQSAGEIGNVYCNKLVPITIGNTYNCIQGISVSDAIDMFIVFINDIKNMSVDNANTWLSNHNLTLYYVLNTPTTTKITDPTLIAQLNAFIGKTLYAPTTVVLSTGTDLEPMLYITYEEYFNYFDFDKILLNGYEIDEQPNIISKKQFANGKRKKITTEYTDVKIKVNLGCFDGDTLADYLENLQDGEYQYYSLKDKQKKKANFIVTIPTQKVQNSADEIIVDDFEAILEKSSDVQ